MKRIVIISAVVAVTVIACGGGAVSEPPTVTPIPPPTPTPRTIQGSVILDGSVLDWTAGEPCEGSGGYDDMRAGAQVVVRDASGTVVGTGSLGNGVGAEMGMGDTTFKCKFKFKVENLPESDFYSVEVSHRGEINYSAEDLDARGWQVSLTLGG